MNQVIKHITELKNHKTVWLLRFDIPTGRLTVQYRNGSRSTYNQVPKLYFDDLVVNLRAGDEQVWVFPDLSASHYLNFPLEWWTNSRWNEYYIDKDGHVRLDLNSNTGKRLRSLFKASCRANPNAVSKFPGKSSNGK